MFKYIILYVPFGMSARTRQYITAISFMSAFSESNTYTLANSTERMEALWWDDFDTESIFKLAVKRPTESAGQTGAIFLPYTEGSSPDYIPTKTLVDLYDDADYRKDVYFMGLSMTTATGISGNIQAFCKFPEHGKLSLLRRDCKGNCR